MWRLFLSIAYIVAVVLISSDQYISLPVTWLPPCIKYHRFSRLIWCSIDSSDLKAKIEHLSASGEYLKNITKTTHTHTQRCVRRNMCDVLSSTNVNLIYGIEHAHRVERYRNIQAVYSLQESESRRNIVYFVYTYIYLLKYSCDSLSIHLSLWSPQTFRYR